MVNPLVIAVPLILWLISRSKKAANLELPHDSDMNALPSPSDDSDEGPAAGAGGAGLAPLGVTNSPAGVSSPLGLTVGLGSLSPVRNDNRVLLGDVQLSAQYSPRAFPTPGFYYRIVKGDNPSAIARKALAAAGITGNSDVANYRDAMMANEANVGRYSAARGAANQSDRIALERQTITAWGPLESAFASEAFLPRWHDVPDSLVGFERQLWQLRARAMLPGLASDISKPGAVKDEKGRVFVPMGDRNSSLFRSYVNLGRVASGNRYGVLWLPPVDNPKATPQSWVTR